MAGFDFEQWKRWRYQTILLYFNGAFLLGLVYGIYFGTEYLYIKDILHNPDATFWFGMASGGKCVTSVLCGVAGSIYYDFTRNIREITLFVYVCLFAGNAVYSTSISVWYVVVGNVFFGAAGAGVVTYTAELTHILDESMLTKQLSYNSLFFTTGMLAGPAFSYVFVLVDTTWSGWRISYGNMPALVMGIYSFLTLLLNIVYLRNLSIMYDLKADREFSKINFLKQSRRSDPTTIGEIVDDDKLASDTEIYEIDAYQRLIEDGREKYEITTVKQYMKTFFMVMMERHFAILLFITLIVTFTNILTLRLIVVKVGEVLQWSASRSSNMRIVSVIFGIGTSLGTSFLSKRVRDYYILYAAIVATTALAGLMALSSYAVARKFHPAAFYYACASLFGATESVSHIVSVSMVAKLVRSEFQGVAECVRYSIMFVGFAFASFAISVADKYTMVFCLCTMALNVVCAIIFPFEHGFYKNLKYLS